MCGIAGFIDYNKKSNFSILKNMTDVLFHRGPDDNGYDFFSFNKYNLGMGHRRLSILDLSSSAHQPMKFEDIEIVYNGEIYNFKEIRNELEKYGYQFVSDSDTEVILKAYHKWGIKAVNYFNGMFAIAIYDKSKNQLILIRDRAGVKPLYYYHKNGLFMFASELKSFHKNPFFEKKINQKGLESFFKYAYIIAPYSIFDNTYKLKAGHYLIFDIDKSQIQIEKYWDVVEFYNKPKLNISFEEAKEETKKLFKSAFEYRLISDVPVGVFLSGGYDSSLVTAILQKNMTQKLKTFTIGFEEDEYNEAGFAKKIANYLNTDHYEYYCTKSEAIKILPILSEVYDEPLGDNSTIPTILLSKFTKNYVKVSLSADGGDELFGGYDRYLKAIKYYKYLKNMPFKKLMAKLLKNISPHNIPLSNNIYNFYFRYNKMIEFLDADNQVELMNNIRTTFNDIELNNLFNNSFLPFKVFEINLDKKFNTLLDELLAIDYKTYLTDDILMKIDRATMSVSLESREPLLDYRLNEFIFQLPIEYKIKNNEKKFLLKSIAYDFIPKSLLERPKKGFVIPLKKWLKEEFKEYVSYYLSEKNLKTVGMFNIEYIKKLKYEWINDKIDHTSKIWLLLLFMMWYERWGK